MVYKHSRDATSYEITFTIHIDSQFSTVKVMKKRGFVLWKPETSDLDLVDL